ncbi:hypothetical protein ACFLRB_03700 [Acidobacteriota bacterium]
MKRERLIKTFKVALFLLLFIALNHAVGRWFLEKRLAGSRTGFIDREFHKVEKKIEILAMGDSHVATGIDPRVFQHAFNFSLYGENYIYNYYKLKYILKRNPQIKTIILPVDIHSFSSWRADRFLHDFYWIKYVDYLQVGYDKGEVLRFVGKYIKGKWFPYIGEYETAFGLPQLDERKRQVALPEIIRGFVVKRETFEKNRKKRTRQRVRLHYQNHHYVDDVVARYFEKILKLCAFYKKNLVLVKFPVTEIYFRYASDQVPVEELYDRAKRLIKTYPNVRLLDYQNLFFENDAPYFDDPDHLNRHGAKILSQKIRRDLKDLL